MSMGAGQKGFTLIEILISLAILGIMGVGIFGALGGGIHAISATDEMGTARNLAESQLDHIKNLDYDITGEYPPAPIPAEDAGYTAQIITGEPAGRDVNIQRLTVIIRFHGKNIIRLEGYKVR